MTKPWYDMPSSQRVLIGIVPARYRRRTVTAAGLRQVDVIGATPDGYVVGYMGRGLYVFSHDALHTPIRAIHDPARLKG